MPVEAIGAHVEVQVAGGGPGLAGPATGKGRKGGKGPGRAPHLSPKKKREKGKGKEKEKEKGTGTGREGREHLKKRQTQRAS